MRCHLTIVTENGEKEGIFIGNLSDDNNDMSAAKTQKQKQRLTYRGSVLRKTMCAAYYRRRQKQEGEREKDTLKSELTQSGID